MAVGNRLPLHRQLHLDTGFCFCVEDGYAHALLYARSKHRGCSDQITPGKGGERQTEREKERRRKNTGGGGRKGGEMEGRQETQE